MPRHGCLTSPSVSVSKRALSPRFSPGRPDRTGRAAGRSRAGWTAALRRARPGGRSGTKPRLSLRCSSAASLPRGVRRLPGLPRAVPARRAAAARPRGARGLPRPRGRAALPSPPLRREIARSPGLGCAEGRTAAGGARGCGCPEMGCASSRLCLYPQCTAARVTLPGGSSRWAALGGGGVGVGLSLSFFFFPPPRCSREGSREGCLCMPLRAPHAPCRGQMERLTKFGDRAYIFLKEASDIYLSACLFHRTPVPLSAIAWFVL